MRAINIHEASFELEGDEPEGYATGEALAVRGLEPTQITVRLFEAAPGQTVCPYHYEYKEEWLLLVSGTLELRDPDGRHPLRAGDLVRFPLGPEGAHQVTNRGDQPARLLMWSDRSWPEIAVYPDSDKIGAWSGNEADEVMLLRRDGHAGYYEGEV